MGRAMDEYRLDKSAIRKAFARSAFSYDSAAVLQREVCRRTLEHLDPIRINPRLAIDLGTGTGHALKPLHARYPRAVISAVDLSLPMVLTARRKQSLFARQYRFVCADADALPFASASVDLIVSNLMLQWSPDLDMTLRECRRILRPGGLLLFATFGPDTLSELRTAWRRIDSSAHVHLFVDMHDIGDALIRAGFGSPVLEAERLTMHYQRFNDLLTDLKTLGATNATIGRRRGLTGRNRLASLEAAYRADLQPDSSIPATYEVVYGHCWSPMPAERRQDGSTIATFPFSSLSTR